MAIFSEFPLGDMLARYVIDGERHVGLCLIPLALRGQTLEKRWAVESLVQLHVRGDSLSNGYGNGHTMATTLSTSRMHLLSQRREGDSIVMPARHPHAVFGQEQFKMLLVVVF